MEILFESDNYTLEKVNEFKLIITHKPTNKKSTFEGFAAQGIINTMYQQENIGNDNSKTLERISNVIMEKGGFK